MKCLQPYTTRTLAELGHAKPNHLDVLCSDFPADCLETREEIALEGKAEFLAAVGGQSHDAPVIDDRPEWISQQHLARLTRNQDAAKTLKLPQTMAVTRGPRRRSKEIAMKITASTLHFETTHQKQENYSLSTALRTWGDGRSTSTGLTRAPLPPPSAPPSTPVHISDAGRTAQADDCEAIQTAIESANNDPRLRLLRAMIAMLTGHDPLDLKTENLLGPGTDNAAPPESLPAPAASSSQGETTPSPQAPPAATPGWGLEYERHETYSESEQLSFSAQGTIRTADGQEIRFDVSMQLSRSFTLQSDVVLRLGEARQKKDPLILNFGGNAAQLSSQRFAFDLDADGKTENIHFASGGSGFLAIDRNGNGKIDNGGELFGTKSGDGFADLSALDSDGNGWIDENDASYGQLRLLNKDASGQDHLKSLHEANVGAIALARIASPFALRDVSNAQQGDIRSSSVFLREDGPAGIIQQVDLTV